MELEHLRSEVDAAVAENLLIGGSTGRLLDRPALVARFLQRGASRATLYRWIGECITSGRAGEEAVRRVKKATAKRAQDTTAAEDAARLKRKVAKRLDRKRAAGQTDDQAIAELVRETLPPTITADDFASRGPVSATDYLQRCIAAAESVMAYARDESGKPRASKLLLVASEHLRRCIETAQKMAERMHEARRIEEFYAAVIDEVRLESPQTAKRILQRLDTLAQHWAGL